jgi:hypothetical protein
MSITNAQHEPLTLIAGQVKIPYTAKRTILSFGETIKTSRHLERNVYHLDDDAPYMHMAYKTPDLEKQKEVYLRFFSLQT